MKLRVLQALTMLCCLSLSQAYAQTKIVGGVKSDSSAWPSAVALLNKSIVATIEAGLAINGTVYPTEEANFRSQTCGGSLIDEKWVLTAAHCVTGDTGELLEPGNFYILEGTNDLMSGGDRLTVKSIVVHDAYSYVMADSDIALLELDSPASSSTVSMLDIDPEVDTIATVVGWGDMTVSSSGLPSSYPNELYEVNVPVISREKCADVYGSEFTVNMMCAGYLSVEKDSCQGDSGGPLFVSDGEFKQAGIVSWGYGCAESGSYGVYTRLSQFGTWIDTVKSGGSYTIYVPPQSSSGGGGSFWFGFPLLIMTLLTRKLIIRSKKGS